MLYKFQFFIYPSIKMEIIYMPIYRCTYECIYNLKSILLYLKTSIPYPVLEMHESYVFLGMFSA